MRSMAGKRRPLKRRTADEVVTGQKGPFLKPCTTVHLSAPKEAVAGEEGCQHGPMEKGSSKAGQLRTPKRKAEEAAETDSSEGEKDGYAAAKGGEAPRKRMTRLPQEEVEWILAQAVDADPAPRDFESLRRRNPGLLPSPEEEMDESTVLLYTVARAHYDARKSFSKFQARVRGEHDERGYVEVDDGLLAIRAELRAWSEEARKEAFKDFTWSDSDDD